MSKRIRKNKFQYNKLQPMGITQIERQIDNKQVLTCLDNCNCKICILKLSKPIERTFTNRTDQSSSWVLQILRGLTPRGVKSIKLYIPDICFPNHQGLQIFQTCKKDNRLKKLPGTTPIKQLYKTFLKMRKEYKNSLEQQYQNKTIKDINPQFIYKDYFNQLVPSFFNANQTIQHLKNNKNHVQKYILHENKKYLITAIQQHKMNDKQLFCAVRFKDNNYQLFNQRQFELFTQNYKNIIPNEIFYVQGFIKSSQSKQSMLYSQYNIDGPVNTKLYQQATLQILVMLEGISKHDHRYIDLESLESSTYFLMKISSAQYTLLMTYKIVEYLAMSSRIYVKNIKLKWVINDIHQIYIQDVLSYQKSEKPLKKNSFYLAKVQQSSKFYRDSRQFIEIHRSAKNFVLQAEQQEKWQIIKQQQIIKKINQKHDKLQKKARIKLTKMFHTIEIDSKSPPKRYEHRTIKKLKPISTDKYTLTKEKINISTKFTSKTISID